MLYALLLFTVFLTSVLSGVLGMAGGMVLMAVLVLSLGVASAMILHGMVQATANGSRAWFLREHIRWRLLPAYCFGAAIAAILFWWLALVPDPAVVMILIGLFPWSARVTKRFRGLDITKPTTTVSCGLSVTSAQLLAGASGPLLDVFYLRAPLNRQEIVANKAVTQTLGHIVKVLYYGFFIGVATQSWSDFSLAGLPLEFIFAAMLVAVFGTKVGTKLLLKWNDQSFMRASQTIILTIATLCILQGLWALGTAWFGPT